jgi:hypothetical protein
VMARLIKARNRPTLPANSQELICGAGLRPAIAGRKPARLRRLAFRRGFRQYWLWA